MAEYMIQIIEDEWEPSEYSPEEFQAVGDQHRAFAQAVEEAGAKILHGNALQPSSTAVRITPAKDGAEPVYTDGPFPELKELVTGYYVIDAPDEATARRVAALCPSGGRLELWPIFDTSGM